MAEDVPQSLLELARSLNGRPGPVCRIHTLLETHPLADEIRELIDATKAKEIQYSTAVIVFEKAGIPLKSDTISRHSRGLCSCH